METITQPTTDTPTGRRLTRPRDNRVLAGVSAALGELTGIATGFIRLVFLVLALFGGFGVLLYAVGWVLLPSSDAAQSPAEQWMSNLTTPGKRTGAVLIGIAALILLAPFAPFAVIVAAALLVAGLIFTRNKNNN